MSAGIKPLRSAVKSKLEGDATLGALINGVYDYVPETPAHNYIVLGEFESEDWSTITTNGEEIIYEILVYSREKPSDDCADILARIHALLHEGTLTISGYTLITNRLEGADLQQSKRDHVFEGTISFIARMQEN